MNSERIKASGYQSLPTMLLLSKIMQCVLESIRFRHPSIASAKTIGYFCDHQFGEIHSKIKE